MKGIILAAGRGSRMSGLTEEQPKCLVEIAGQPLLYWQLTALAQAGIDDLAVVCGYRAEKIQALTGKTPVAFTPLLNPRWAATNMLSTLFSAAEWAAGEDCVVSYSDIVYPASHVEALLACRAPVAITYDVLWEELWRLRQANPLDDAETFRQQDGRLLEIGGKPERLDQVEGQYMGLFRIAPAGWEIFHRHARILGDVINHTDMTGFIRRLLADGAEVGTVPVQGRWCEVDNGDDLEKYQQMLETNDWLHDWRD